jgi:SAM-dependent methyltransferase
VGRVALVKGVYQDKRTRFGVGSPGALGWTKEEQLLRFEQFTRVFDFSNKTVLDVGCGFGDFHLWLLSRGIEPSQYIGVDLLEENIEYAKDQVPGVFVTGDFLALPFPSVDIALLSGTLNINHEGWRDACSMILDKMWSLSNEGIGFNMLSAWGRYASPEDGRLLDPLYWLQYVYRKSSRVVFFHDYLGWDFTIAVKRWPQEIESEILRRQCA